MQRGFGARVDGAGLGDAGGGDPEWLIAAIAGMPDLGLAAAAELGVARNHVALVPEPATELVAVPDVVVPLIDVRPPSPVRSVPYLSNRNVATRSPPSVAATCARVFGVACGG